MESKKFIIITISIILLGGMGTFVFASRSDDLTVDDINYKKEDSSYKKVDTTNTPTIVNPGSTDNSNGGNVDNDENTGTIKLPVRPSAPIQNKPVQNGGASGSQSTDENKKDPIISKPSETTKPEEPSKPSVNPSEPSDDEKPGEDKGEELSAIVTASNNNGYKKTFRDITVTITANREILPVAGWNLDESKKVLTKTFGKKELVDSNGNVVPIVNKSLILKGLSDNKEIEVYYSVENYNPNCPEVEISKIIDRDGNVTTTIKQILDKPLENDGSWIYSDDDEGYVKIDTITGDNGDKIEIILPDGKKEVFESTLSVEVKISNFNENDQLADLTNKPVTVTIISNNEICNALEWVKSGWNISDDYKILTKEFSAITEIKGYIYDLAGNSVYIDKKVENIDMTPVFVKSAKVNRGNIEVRVDDFIKLPAGWYSKVDTNIKSIYKPLSEFSSTNREIVEFLDMYGNISKYEIVLNSDNTVTYTLVS